MKKMGKVYWTREAGRGVKDTLISSGKKGDKKRKHGRPKCRRVRPEKGQKVRGVVEKSSHAPRKAKKTAAWPGGEIGGSCK